jgi:hypothetical protein
MESYDIEKQKPAVRVFIELDREIDRLSHERFGAGWRQRDALITHVYSGYNNHEDLMAKKPGGRSWASTRGYSSGC